MSETKPTEQTTVQQVDINIDDIFGGAPGADSIMLPTEEEKKPKSILDRENIFRKPFA